MPLVAVAARARSSLNASSSHPTWRSSGNTQHVSTFTFRPRVRRLDRTRVNANVWTDLFLAPERKRERAKASLLDAISRTERGLIASDEEKAVIDELARDLERMNPNKNSLACAQINGEWKLAYTTSASILGASKPAIFRPRGAIYQTIDTSTLRAQNRETSPFYNAVDADLSPTSKSAVNVQFKTFSILGGVAKIKAPENARGALDITYVDEDVRVSRGDKGNLFVLTMSDRTKRLPRDE